MITQHWSISKPWY